MSARRWVRKWSRDLASDGFSPLPTQVVSNEEYVPLPRTPEQRRLAQVIDDTAHRHARRLGMPRRDFLASSAGMASAFLALTAAVKDQILGLNAARVYGIDPDTHRNPVPPDYVSKLKAVYREEGARPSLTQYGWVLDPS